MRFAANRENMKSRVIVVCIACALMIACESERETEDTTPAVPGTPISINPDPAVQVGVTAGDTLYELHQVVTPFVTSNKTLVIPLRDANSIREYSPTGEFIRTLGGPGSGPGEFRLLIAAWPRGDTIEAYDFRLRRITRFLPDGTVQLVTLDADLPDLSMAPNALGDGWVVGGVADAGPGRRDRMVFHRFARDGSDLGEIATTDGMARYETPEFRGPEPLSPRPFFAAVNDRVYVAESLTPRIRVLDSQAAALQELTWEPAAGPAPGELLAAVVDSATAAAPPDQAAALRTRLEAAPSPERLSVFWSMIVDELGFVWIQRYEPLRHAAALGGLSESSGAGGTWQIISPSGVAAGLVEMPQDLQPVQITADAVVGIARDDLGVESVRMHTLQRR
jgi:hypothetical protein